MARPATIEIPKKLTEYRMPRALHARLQELLDRQDEGHALTAAERKEAEGLVDLAEFLTLLKLQAQVSRAGRGKR